MLLAIYEVHIYILYLVLLLFRNFYFKVIKPSWFVFSISTLRRFLSPEAIKTLKCVLGPGTHEIYFW